MALADPRRNSPGRTDRSQVGWALARTRRAPTAHPARIRQSSPILPPGRPRRKPARGMRQMAPMVWQLGAAPTTSGDGASWPPDAYVRLSLLRQRSAWPLNKQSRPLPTVIVVQTGPGAARVPRAPSGISQPPCTGPLTGFLNENCAIRQHEILVRRLWRSSTNGLDGCTLRPDAKSRFVAHTAQALARTP